MTIKRMVLAWLALAWAWQPGIAQDTTRDSGDILRAILLPTVSEILRERGVPPEEIEAAIDGARQRGVPVSEMADLFDEAARTVDEHGPIENFGGFVQEQLAAGLRGRDLADAIRAEHARRGIGKGNKLESRRQGPGAERGPGAAGRRPGDERGPGAAGQGQADERGPGAARPGADRAPPAEVGDSAGRRGPPAGRVQPPPRPDTVSDTIPGAPNRRRPGGNGGEG
jgi:hypothetical protein